MDSTTAAVLYDSTGTALATASTSPPSQTATTLVTKSIEAPLYVAIQTAASLPLAANYVNIHGLAHTTVTLFYRITGGTSTSTIVILQENRPGGVGGGVGDALGRQQTQTILAASYGASTWHRITMRSILSTSISINFQPTGGTATGVDAYIVGKASGPAITERPMFYATYDRIVPAQNKYMATLFNGSADKAYAVHRVWSFNWQQAAVTGVLLEQYLAKITARTAGTTVTVQTADTTETAPAIADTNSSAVTENHIMKRHFGCSEEMVIASTGITLSASVDRNYQLIWDTPNGCRPLILYANEGVSVRMVTNSTVGSCSYIIEFSQEN
jgi:hypothetical protein